MKRFTKNEAFTLVELLIVVVIVGVITVATLHTVNRNSNQYKKLYYTAYYSLVQAVGNMYQEWNPGDGDCNTGYWSKDCWNVYSNKSMVSDYGDISTLHWESMTDNGGIENYPRQYPGFLFGAYNEGSIDGKGTDENFCKTLTSKFSTIEKTNECQSFISGVKPSIDLSKPTNFLNAFCALERVSGKGDVCSGDSGGSIIPSFTAPNGQRFYISVVLAANPPFVESGNQQERMQFRFVVVDLNGSDGPNTQLKKGNIFPDLVLFAITSSGQVIPLGLPEFNESYLNAVVKYPKYTTNPDPVNDGHFLPNEITTSDLYSFYYAKMHAWAGDPAGGAVNSYFGQPFISNVPLSYSNLFYYWGINCAQNGCNAKDDPSGGVYYAESLMTSLIYQFILKGNANDDVSDYVTNFIGGGIQSHFVPTQVTSNNIDTARGCAYKSEKCRIEMTEP